MFATLGTPNRKKRMEGCKKSKHNPSWQFVTQDGVLTLRSNGRDCYFITHTLSGQTTRLDISTFCNELQPFTEEFDEKLQIHFNKHRESFCKAYFPEFWKNSYMKGEK